MLNKIEQYRKELQEQYEAYKQQNENDGKLEEGILLGIKKSLDKFNQMFLELELSKFVTTSIQPSDMDSFRAPMGTKWRDSKTEFSAMYLLRMAQAFGSWRDFTKAEIDVVCNHDFRFNRLIKVNNADIIKNNDETFSFTDSFIIEMYSHLKIKK